MNKIDFKSGKIVYNQFLIDFTKKYSEQLECLLEDLLQVQYAHNYLLDVGWYPEYESEGEFIVQIVKEHNWENPLYKRKSRKKKDLIQDLNSAIKIIEDEQAGSGRKCNNRERP